MYVYVYTPAPGFITRTCITNSIYTNTCTCMCIPQLQASLAKLHVHVLLTQYMYILIHVHVCVPLSSRLHQLPVILVFGLQMSISLTNLHHLLPTSVVSMLDIQEFKPDFTESIVNKILQEVCICTLYL